MIIAAGGLRGPDYFILAGYFTLMLIIGVFFWRYMKDMRDYFSGHNQIPWWLSGVSFYMSSFSAFIFVASSEVAHRHGFVAISLAWMVVPTTIVGALVFSKLWRRARIDSPIEYLETRFSFTLRQTFGWAKVPLRMVDNGLRLYATGVFVSGVAGLNLQMSILLIGLIAIGYTFAGGLWAVTITDFVQFIVLMAGVVVLLVFSLGQVGGISGLIHGSPQGFFRFTAPPALGGSYILAWFILLLCNYNTSFPLVQRYYSVRNEREARRVGLVVAVLALIGPVLFFIPALAARQFLPDAPSKDIYAILCRTLLPTGALGLVIAAMFSATMAALSGEYNAMASVLTNDVYLRLINPHASEKKRVMVARINTILFGLTPLLVALYIAHRGGGGLFDKMVTAFGVSIAPIAVPMLAGLAWRRCSNAGAISGFVVGTTVGLVLYFQGNNSTILAFSTFVTTLLVMIVVSLLAPGPVEEQQRREAFTRRLERPIQPEEVPSTHGFRSPFGVAGIAVAAAAILLLSVVPFMAWNAGSKTNLIIGVSLLIVGCLMVLSSRRKTNAQTAAAKADALTMALEQAEGAANSFNRIEQR